VWAFFSHQNTKWQKENACFMPTSPEKLEVKERKMFV
jgi:hypothetical protein